MESSPERPAPGQTIIIERRERAGFFRRWILPILFVAFIFVMLSPLIGVQSGLPSRLSERYVAGDLTASKVAVVEVSGVIMGSEVDHVLKQVRQARDDDNVIAVVLRIDSPGGSVSGADQIWRELSLLGKPIVASMGDMATSGGYYVAAPADRILAEPTTMTGSIGVILELPQIGELLDKIGVNMTTITTGPWKDSGSLFKQKLTPEELVRWKDLIDQTFDRFMRIVAKGRKLPLATVKPLADGRLFTANEALKAKLIDGIGYQDDAIQAAWKLARVESSRVIRYARPVNFLDPLALTQATRTPLGLDAAAMIRAAVPRLMYLAR